MAVDADADTITTGAMGDNKSIDATVSGAPQQLSICDPLWACVLEDYEVRWDGATAFSKLTWDSRTTMFTNGTQDVKEETRQEGNYVDCAADRYGNISGLDDSNMSRGIRAAGKEPRTLEKIGEEEVSKSTVDASSVDAASNYPQLSTASAEVNRSKSRPRAYQTGASASSSEILNKQNSGNVADSNKAKPRQQTVQNNAVSEIKTARSRKSRRSKHGNLPKNKQELPDGAVHTRSKQELLDDSDAVINYFLGSEGVEGTRNISRAKRSFRRRKKMLPKEEETEEDEIVIKTSQSAVKSRQSKSRRRKCMPKEKAPTATVPPITVKNDAAAANDGTEKSALAETAAVVGDGNTVGRVEPDELHQSANPEHAKSASEVPNSSDLRAPCRRPANENAPGVVASATTAATASQTAEEVYSISLIQSDANGYPLSKDRPEATKVVQQPEHLCKSHSRDSDAATKSARPVKVKRTNNSASPARKQRPLLSTDQESRHVRIVEPQRSQVERSVLPVAPAYARSSADRQHGIPFPRQRTVVADLSREDEIMRPAERTVASQTQAGMDRYSAAHTHTVEPEIIQIDTQEWESTLHAASVPDVSYLSPQQRFEVIDLTCFVDGDGTVHGEKQMEELLPPQAMAYLLQMEDPSSKAMIDASARCDDMSGSSSRGQQARLSRRIEPTESMEYMHWWKQSRSPTSPGEEVGRHAPINDDANCESRSVATQPSGPSGGRSLLTRDIRRGTDSAPGSHAVDMEEHATTACEEDTPQKVISICTDPEEPADAAEKDDSKVHWDFVEAVSLDEMSEVTMQTNRTADTLTRMNEEINTRLRKIRERRVRLMKNRGDKAMINSAIEHRDPAMHLVESRTILSVDDRVSVARELFEDDPNESRQ